VRLGGCKGKEEGVTWCRLCCGKGQCACVDPVSWLSTKVTAREGHLPIMPAHGSRRLAL
jgi:hypothetical protein